MGPTAASGRRAARRDSARLGAAALAIGAVICLASCGSPDPGGAAVVSSLPEATAVPSPAVLPYVADAPPAFDARARAVLEALRADGTLAAYASSLVLLSSRVVETGYPSSELKEVFGNGGFEPSPDLVGDATTRTVHLADGTTRTVPVLSARETLELARAGLPGCSAMTTPCPVVVTRAELGTVAADTNHGRVQLPAWQFWSDGLATPYQVIAVDEAALGSLPPPPTIAESGSGGTAGLLGALPPVTVRDRALVVTLGHGACDLGLQGHLLEASDAVVVGGSSSGMAGEVCTANLVGTPATLPLARPLGTRPVVDLSGMVLSTTT